MRSGASDRARGSTTAEFAVLLPAAVLILGIVAAVGLIMLGQLKCAEAARSAVRLAVRGESEGAVAAHASQVAPSGAEVSVGSAGEHVRVEVRALIDVPVLPAFSVRASAWGLREQHIGQPGSGA